MEFRLIVKRRIELFSKEQVQMNVFRGLVKAMAITCEPLSPSFVFG